MRLLTFLLAAVAGQLVAATEWIKVTSPNFELYSTAGERQARQTLQLFEQVRGFFMQVNSSKVTTCLPVTIVGFRNPKEYKPYSPRETAAAYYTGDEQRDFIVMGELGQEASPTAIHEYMHLLVRHSGLKMPIWLNEGFADVYSTLKPVGGQVLLGSIPEGRAYVLSQEKWLSLPTLFGVEHDSPEYNEKNRVGIFYAQSWMLVHMLVLNRAYGESFGKFLVELSGSGSAEGAFSKIYGKTLADVEKDLKTYYHTNLTGILFKAKFEKIDAEKARAASDLEVGLVLGKLTALLGRTDEAAEQLERLAKSHPDSFEVEEGLAYLSWRKNNLDGARLHFRSAVAHGATSWKTYWDYARLLNSSSDAGDERLKVVKKAIELNPELVEARLMLGNELYRSGQYAQALFALREVKQIDPERAAVMFLLMANAAVEVKANGEARKYAEQAKKYAHEPSETAEAYRLLQYLDELDAPPPPVKVAVAPPPREPKPQATAERPVREEEPEPVPVLKRRDSVTAKGRLINLDCLSGVARMYLKVGNTTYEFLLRKPDQVTIRNTGGPTVEMTCGKQDIPISVEYLPVLDEKYGTSGDVRVIEFQR